MRQRALEVLAARYHGTEVTQLFDRLLDDADDEVSASAIARAGDRSPASDLRQLIAHPSNTVRTVAAIRALAKFADPTSAAAIAARLKVSAARAPAWRDSDRDARLAT